MKPLVSILLPHLRAPENNKALRIALDTLVTHTDIDYELLVEGVETRRDIYAVVNNMAQRANSEWLIPFNSDVFVGPNWIRPLYDARDPNAIVSPVMVECGAIPVNDRNLECDFGRRPETFRRSDFEAWVERGGGWRDDWKDSEQAWYFPSLIPRWKFMRSESAGSIVGFDTSLGSYPEPLDMDFWWRWQANGGTFKRVRSFVYHLQVFSDPTRGVRD